MESENKTNSSLSDSSSSDSSNWSKGVDIAQIGLAAWNALSNNQSQREAMLYQKKINREMMTREDNAVQRRARDLALAGMSRYMAAGNPASASAQSGYEAPSIDTSGVSSAFDNLRSDIVSQARFDDDYKLRQEALNLEKLKVNKSIAMSLLKYSLQRRKEALERLLTRKKIRKMGIDTKTANELYRKAESSADVAQNDAEIYLNNLGKTSRQVDLSSTTTNSLRENISEWYVKGLQKFDVSLGKNGKFFSGGAETDFEGGYKSKEKVSESVRSVTFEIMDHLTTIQKEQLLSDFNDESKSNAYLSRLVNSWISHFGQSEDTKHSGLTVDSYIRRKKIEYMLKKYGKVSNY